MIGSPKINRADQEEIGGRVSVVIPTRGRPALVCRAVRSALSQDFPDLEVIVVLDGPDPETESILSLLDDTRLHLLCLPSTVGGSEARNIGIRYARGKWVALLDDDDEWLPGKLNRQYRVAHAMGGPYTFVSCGFIERTETSDRRLPRRPYTRREAFSEYMFVRRGWHSGEGFLQTSTWFVSRQLLIDVPFTRGLQRCQDLDWLLHATAPPVTRVAIIDETLAIFHHDERHERVSRTPDWKFLYNWATANKRYFTLRAFSFFIATFCVPSAARQRAGLGTFVFLLRQCLFLGSPTAKCIFLFLLFWWMPERRRRSLRTFASRAAGTLSPASSQILQEHLPEKAG
jgi:glycosyltransferase involved in cell wall biosynthesis